MKNKNVVRAIGFFLTGVIASAVVQLYYPGVKDAMADRLACIRQSLTARLYNGNVGENKEFTIAYSIPSCYAANGYKIKKTFIYDGEYVAVTYINSSFTAGNNIKNYTNSVGGGGSNAMQAIQ